jgi:hypothetical protein
MRRVGRNVEMPNHPGPLRRAQAGMERMQAEAEAPGRGRGRRATRRGQPWLGAHVSEYFSVGTAVIPTSDTHEIRRRPSPSRSTTRARTA